MISSITQKDKLVNLLEQESINKSILLDFIRLVNQHNIKFVVHGNKSYFPVGVLAIIKGRDAKDFSKNYMDTLVFNQKDGYYTSTALAGKFYKLVGQDLIYYKEEYARQYGINSSKVNALWVADHSGALSYMFQTNKSANNQASRDFQAHATNALELNYKEAIKENNNNNKHVFQTEEEIEEALLRLADYSPIKFTRQVMLENTLRNDKEWNNKSSRRLDLLRVEKRKVFIYEIKRGPISSDHISQTIGLKGYIDLVKEKYPNKSVKLVFITDSDKVLTDCAQRLIKTMSRHSLKNIEFKTVQDLSKEIIDITLETIPTNLRWQYQKHRLANFQYLLN